MPVLGGRSLLFGAVALALSLVFSLGCSSNKTVFVSATDGGGPAVDDSALPPIGADQLGARCSGFGTGVDQTAAFPTDTCPAGVCLVDGRSFSFYCSADCDKVRCPEGYLCQATDNGVKHACFKDPSYVPPPVVDAGPVSYLDAKLPGYLANTSAATTLALSDFKDPKAAQVDLVILVVGSLWDVYSPQMLTYLQTANVPRVTWLAVLSEGAPSTGATAANLTKWHTTYRASNMLLDPNTTTLAEGLRTFEAFPTLVALDARTLEEVDRHAGFQQGDALAAQVETWRGKLKP